MTSPSKPPAVVPRRLEIPTLTPLPKDTPSAFTKPLLEEDAYSYYARNLFKSRALTKTSGALPHPIVPDDKVRKVSGPNEGIVGILGAGAGGLYAALILDSLGIPYHIIEARDRVGGRLFTHRFKDQTGNPFNYYDVGAMRFPSTLAMRRLFRLFQYPPLNQGNIQLNSLLVPYYFTAAGGNAFLDYNGANFRQNAVPPAQDDPFHSQAVLGGQGGQIYINVTAQTIVEDVIRPFATGILNDLETGGTGGWNQMLQVDHYSTRAYMSLKYNPTPNLGLPQGPLPTNVVNWCETFDKSTGWYDRALSETVLEAIAFGWNPNASAPDWFCVSGGAERIAECMRDYLLSRNPNAITYRSRVTSIERNTDPSMNIIANNTDKYEFSHVISTIPLPVLRTVDLTNAGLSPLQSTALRQLDYGPSIKVGMQFKTAWWTTGPGFAQNPIVGGQSYTDRPLRTVVYPSFGQNVKQGTTTTLIASYCWTEDAMRMGALTKNDDEIKAILKELVLRELSAIHGISLEYLYEQLIDLHGWSWSNDQHTMGAFAFFGPGKFGDLYTSLNAPAGGGCLHLAGEALSVRHAWVEGALDSAWRAVSELLHMPGWESYLPEFYRLWGVNPEWVEHPALGAVFEGKVLTPRHDFVAAVQRLAYPNLFPN